MSRGFVPISGTGHIWALAVMDRGAVRYAMGVHVILDIDPIGIDPAAWASAYNETVKLLTRWTPRLLGWEVRSIRGVRIPMYTRSIVFDEASPTKACWRVVGDRESMLTAECQSLQRDLSRYSARRQERVADVTDIVVSAAAPDREHTGGAAQVFGDKTQGCPYHFAMLAAAMVIEERFPRSAMVWGDIDRGQAEVARRLSAPILGRELPLPVRVDAPRLVERLSARYRGDELAKAFKRVFNDDASRGYETMLRLFPGEDGARAWRSALAGYRSPNAIGAIRLVIDWLNAGRDLAEVCQYACLSPEGPRYVPLDFASALASTWITVPPTLRGSLEVFQRPEGASETVASLFGGFFLDMEATGRHLRIGMEPPEVEVVLSKVFGEQGPALFARLCDETAAFVRQLSKTAPGVQNLISRGEEAANDDTESLAAVHDAKTLGRVQSQWLRGVAWNIRRLVAQIRGDARMAEVLGDIDKGKLWIVRCLSERAPVLTEDAWEAVLSEQDEEVITWWIGLLCADSNELHFSQVRRALFESREVLRHTMSMARDAEQMKEVEAQVRLKHPEL